MCKNVQGRSRIKKSLGTTASVCSTGMHGRICEYKFIRFLQERFYKNTETR